LGVNTEVSEVISDEGVISIPTAFTHSWPWLGTKAFWRLCSRRHYWLWSISR
jgi:hypothetical protein